MDWSKIIGFTPVNTNNNKEWKINWYMGSPTVIGSDGRYFNTSKKDGDKLYFYRDIGVGRLERVKLRSQGSGISVVIRQNAKQYCYDDWNLADMFFALPEYKWPLSSCIYCWITNLRRCSSLVSRSSLICLIKKAIITIKIMYFVKFSVDLDQAANTYAVISC